jgi:hypothetical protein
MNAMKKSPQDLESDAKKPKIGLFSQKSTANSIVADKALSNKSKLGRRLDSLARLLEGSMICASVYLDVAGLLYVTTNATSPTKTKFPDNNNIKFLTSIFLHFTSEDFLKSNHKLLTDGDMHILIKIYNEKMKANFHSNIKEMPLAEEAQLKKIMALFNEQHEGWLTFNGDDFFSKYLNEHDAIDINKPDLSHAQRLKYRNNIIDVQRVFASLWLHVRDYLKFKKISLKNINLINDYRIILTGGQDEHAEMRILGFLLSEHQLLLKEGIKLPEYIGISKLCCSDCICVIKSINKMIDLNSNKIQAHESAEIIAVFDSDSAEVEKGQVRLESANNLLDNVIFEETKAELDPLKIQVRGSHSLSFQKWKAPLFVQGKIYSQGDDYLEWSVKRFLDDKHHVKTDSLTAWQRVKKRIIKEEDTHCLKKLEESYNEILANVEIIKANAVTAVKKMYPELSSSEVESFSTGSPDDPQLKSSLHPFDQLVEFDPNINK